MPKSAHSHESWMKIVFKSSGLQVVVTKAKTILRDNIAGEGIECIAKYQNVAIVLGLSDTFDHEFYLVSDDRLELGDAPLGEHGI
jgi:hypothetical protein